MRVARILPLALATLFAAAQAASAKQPGDFGGSFAGEVVVRSLSSTRVVVGIDEHGLGFADRLFFADIAQPVGPFSYRSSVSKVDYSNGQLVVVVPSEQRTLLFQVPLVMQGPAIRKQERGADPDAASVRAAADGGDFLQSIGFEVVRIDHVTQLAAFAGMRRRVALDDVEKGRLEGIGPRNISAADRQIPQNQVPPGPDDGTGCRSACSASCGGGSTCSVTCTNGHCGSCDCATGHGAACSCN